MRMIVKSVTEIVSSTSLLPCIVATNECPPCPQQTGGQPQNYAPCVDIGLGAPVQRGERQSFQNAKSYIIDFQRGSPGVVAFWFSGFLVCVISGSMVLWFLVFRHVCSPRFLVFGICGFLVFWRSWLSGFPGFLVFWGFWLSRFSGFCGFLGFWLSGFLVFWFRVLISVWAAIFAKRHDAS